MISKISELAKTNENISDFHLRGGSDISYRVMGDIVIEPNSKIEDKDLSDLLKQNCEEEEIKKFEEKKELDTAAIFIYISVNMSMVLGLKPIVGSSPTYYVLWWIFNACNNDWF